MKSYLVAVAGLLAAGAIAAPMSLDDSFNYHNNIDNAVTIEPSTRELDDAFNYHNNIDNAVSAKDAESDAFNYSNNIDNAVSLKEVNTDAFNYHNNIDNAVTVTDADGTKVVLSSPYSDDVSAADPKSVLGE